jgi:hypothetical protein
MFDGLADEHAIKRISMQRGELMKMEHSPFIEWKRRNPMPFPLLHHKTLNGTRERQLPKRMLHRNLPDGHRAEQYLI